MLISNLYCIFDNHWSIDGFFLLVKIKRFGKAFVSFSDPRKLLLFLLYVFCVWHWLLLDGYLLTKGNKAYINAKLYWSISLLIDSKSLFGFTEVKVCSTSLIFLWHLSFRVYCWKKKSVYSLSSLILWSSYSSLNI